MMIKANILCVVKFVEIINLSSKLSSSFLNFLGNLHSSLQKNANT